jgi:acyl-CoA thioesterase I
MMVGWLEPRTFRALDRSAESLALHRKNVGRAFQASLHREDVGRAFQASLRFRGAILCLLLASWSCGSSPEARREDPAPPAPAAQPAATSGSGRPRVVILGDSLTAGLGLPREDSYPALLQQRLNDQGLDYELVNAGVSGDTSAGGLARLDWALEGDVRVLVVAVGANDGLRGLPVEALRQNLAQIIERARQRGIRVILAGMEAPPNYGREYIVSFHKVYPALAREYNVPFVPFLLQNVAGIATLNQADGIHPNGAGARIVADNVWPVLKEVAEQARGEHGGR